MKPLPAQSFLREAFDYDPSSGALRWRNRPNEHFTDARAAASFNTQFAGKPALSYINKTRGYRVGHLGDRMVAAHRVIWKWMTGKDPTVIDHINGCRTDNRWANLRDTDVQGNHRNMRLPPTNKSGRIGVRRRDGKWIACIRCDGEQKYLGCSDSFEVACSLRAEAEKRLGYHPNHGKRA